MRPYRAVLSARFRMLLQYRSAALGGLVTQMFFGLVFIMIYEAFYRSSSTPQPMTFQDLVTYVWLGQALLAMLPWNVDSEVRAMMSDGTVAYELLRPVDTYALWYGRAMAWRTAPTVLRAVPMTILAMLFFGMRLPDSWTSLGAFAISLLGSLLLGCSITTLMNIALFWTVSGEGIRHLVPTLVVFLSGMNVPLPLFPAWLQRIVYVLPFRGLVDTPFRFYVGHLPPRELLPLLGHQLGWTLAFVLLGRWLMARGVRRVVVQGG